MTPFVAFPDGAQVYIDYSLFGRACSNRLWFRNRQPPNTTDQLDNLAAGVRDWHQANLLPFLSQDVQLLSVRAADWNADPPPYTSSVVSGLFGGVAEESQSANVADRVVFAGDNSQRFPNNSNFVLGIPKSAIIADVVDPGFRNNVFEAYVTLIDAAAVFGPFPAWEWRVGSSWLGGVLRAELVTARTDFIRYKNPWSTQRRRRAQP